jgi:hypothetical protein
VNACTPVINACKTAGYFFGGTTQRMGLLDDCYNPLLRGATLANVRITDDEIKACRASGGRI